VSKRKEESRALMRRPVAELPAWMIAELAASPCMCSVIKSERKPCTSCRARDVLAAQSGKATRP